MRRRADQRRGKEYWSADCQRRKGESIEHCKAFLAPSNEVMRARGRGQVQPIWERTAAETAAMVQPAIHRHIATFSRVRAPRQMRIATRARARDATDSFRDLRREIVTEAADLPDEGADQVDVRWDREPDGGKLIVPNAEKTNMYEQNGTMAAPNRPLTRRSRPCWPYAARLPMLLACLLAIRRMAIGPCRSAQKPHQGQECINGSFE